MTTLYPGIDPLAPEEFLNSAVKMRFTMKFREDRPDWKAIRYLIINELDEYLEGMFDIVLSQENAPTTTTAEYILYVEQHEAEKAAHYVKHREFIA